MDNDETAQAFTSYAAAVRPRLRRRAYRLCGDWHEAEDLTQDALIQVYRRWLYLRRRGELESYAQKVVLRAFLMSRRRARWHRETLIADPPETAVEDDASYGSIDSRLAMRATLASLGPRQRAVIMLRFWEDLSVKQVAAALDVSPGTVSSQTLRALATLRAQITEEPTLEP